MIERVSLRACHSFQRWLGDWARLRAEGWDVTVVLAPDESHAIGLAYRPTWAEPAQLPLFAGGAGA